MVFEILPLHKLQSNDMEIPGEVFSRFSMNPGPRVLPWFQN